MSSRLGLPSDFAKEIAKTLKWSIDQVNDYFDFSEDKQGFFWAKLKPKMHLDTPDFRAVCKLTRELGGEDYLQGARAWKIGGPFVKKGAEKPSGHETDSELAKKEVDSAIRGAIGQPKEPPHKQVGKCMPFEPRLIALDAILIPAFLPTRELITYEKLAIIRDSMRKHGLKYAIKVRPGPEPGKYELVDGYLRFTSAQQLSWKEIQVEISERTDEQVIVESVITNKDRIEEDPITLAKKFDILVNAFGWTQQKLAEELGIDQATISNHIRLLRLPKEVQHYLLVNNVSFHQALLLLALETPELQTRLAKEVAEEKLTTRELEQRISDVQPKPQVTPQEHKKTEETKACARCGEPIEGRPVCLEDDKFYDPECAELEAAAAKKGLIPESHVGPLEEQPAPGQEPEPEKAPRPVQIGTFECTECNQHFIIEHLPNGKHKLKQIRSVPT